MWWRKGEVFVQVGNGESRLARYVHRSDSSAAQRCSLDGDNAKSTFDGLRFNGWLAASRGPCSPAVEVLRLFVIDTVSFRRLLPVRFVLVMDLRVVSESRRAVSLGVKPALVRGVE